MAPCVLRTSAHTPLGFTPRQSLLVARAGGFEPRSSELVDKRGRPIGLCRVGGLGATVHGYDRLVELAAGALRDLGLPAGRVAIALGVFEAGRADDDPRFGAAFLHDVATRAGAEVDPERAVVARGDRVAAALALAHAQEWLDRGAEHVVVGAVDSHFHPAVLTALDEGHRLHTLHAEDGYIPGEGAAFALVAAKAPRSEDGRAVRLVHVATGDDPAGRLAPPEEAEPDVAATMTAMVQAVPGPEARWVMTDVNGERHRERWWGFVSARRGIDVGADVQHLPHELGDLGAATGMVALAHAHAAWELGLAPADRALIMLHGENGERGLVVLEEERA